MQHKYYYETVVDAITILTKQGYLIDFNLPANANIFYTSKFTIKNIFRYEGNTDPADEAIVYAIESKDGLKGILVAGYGMSSDAFSGNMVHVLGKNST